MLASFRPALAGLAVVGCLATTSAAQAQDIVDTAVKAGSFNTLVTAVKAAGLVDTLKGKGPFTVFAPTDEAFAKLPAGTLDALLADPKQLESILLYHVASGKVMAKDVAKMGFVDTLLNRSLTVTASPNGDVKINGANVTTADIETSNGVIHVIDTVLVPAS